LRILRFFRFHARFDAREPDAAALDACTARANDLMALSRERIADELLKLLGLPEPSSTMEIMMARGILKPVLPEIHVAAAKDLRNLIAAEKEAAIKAHALRRLAALLRRDASSVDDIGARLRLSKKARKRLACAVDPLSDAVPQALAYRVGLECAIDRLLLAGRTSEAKVLAGWHAPRLPIGGGALIKRGLAEGPIVARTLREIEDRWVAAGFPSGPDFERNVGEALSSAEQA